MQAPAKTEQELRLRLFAAREAIDRLPSSERATRYMRLRREVRQRFGRGAITPAMRLPAHRATWRPFGHNRPWTGPARQARLEELEPRDRDLARALMRIADQRDGRLR